MTLLVFLLASPAAFPGAGAERGPHFFRAVSSTGTSLGIPAAFSIPVRADLPPGTSTPFRLEWIPALGGTDTWDTVALASASNDFAPCEVLLPVPQPADLLWSNSFASASWTQEWNVLSDKDWGWAQLARGEESGGRFETFLRATYPSNSCSPASTTDYGTPEGGGQFLATAGLPPANTLHLRYYVRFHTNFAFVKGGKLPGLFGGTNPFRGGAIPDCTSGPKVCRIPAAACTRRAAPSSEAKRETPMLKAAKLENSDRLRRVHDLLQRGGEFSTMEIVQQAQVCAVNSIIAELRASTEEPVRCK